MHEMKLNPEPFQMIKIGKKTIELRLLDEKRRKIKAGDEIAFTNTENGERLVARVLNLHYFENFARLYKTLPLLKCGYTTETLPLATPADMEKYYSAEEQSKHGVVGIEICVIDSKTTDCQN